MMRIGWFLSLFCGLVMTVVSVNTVAAKITTPVLVTGQLANGFHYSLYPSDDSLTAEHVEDVSLVMNVHIGTNQEAINQQAIAEIVGKAAGQYFGFSRDKYTEFGFDIEHINEPNLTEALQYFKHIAAGKLSEGLSKDAKAFTEKWYQPQFMHLAVAGQIDVAKVEAQIKQLFGGLKSTLILRTPRAFYAPAEGLNLVTRPQTTKNLVRILFAVDEQTNLESFTPAVIGVTIRAHMRIKANQQDGFEFDEAYFTTYGDKQYFQIALKHHGEPVKAAKWIVNEAQKIHNLGIELNDLSGFRMWLVAEAIDHFSPFKPNGKPSFIATQLAYSEVAVQHDLQTTQQQIAHAKDFLQHMDYTALDQSLKQILNAKIRIVTIQNTEITAEQTLQLHELIDNYNIDK